MEVMHMIGIYKIENKITHQVYIGQSTDIKKRWRVHKQQSTYNNPNSTTYYYKLYQAFRKYGLDNFDFSVLEECNQLDLNEREKYWIQQYNSFTNGYNMTLGGDGIIKPSTQKIYAYDRFGNFIQEFTNVQEAAKTLEIDTNIIYNAISKKTLGAGYQWSYEKVPTMSFYINNELPVIAYDLSGKKMHTYNSIREASRMTSDNQIAITTACETRQYNPAHTKLQWRFAADYCQINQIENCYVNSPTAISKYTLEGQFICHYCSPNEALLDMGITDNTKGANLITCINGIQKSFMGFLWTKYGAPVPKPYVDARYGHTTSSNKRIIEQYNKADEFIDEYESAHEAARQIGKPKCANHITECCQGKRKTCEGYKWKYKEVKEDAR